MSFINCFEVFLESDELPKYLHNIDLESDSEIDTDQDDNVDVHSKSLIKLKIMEVCYQYFGNYIVNIHMYVFH